MEKVAVLEHKKQKELEYLIYRAAFFLTDVGLPQKPGDSKLLNGIAKFALNFRVVILDSVVYRCARSVSRP